MSDFSARELVLIQAVLKQMKMEQFLSAVDFDIIAKDLLFAHSKSAKSSFRELLKKIYSNDEGAVAPKTASDKVTTGNSDNEDAGNIDIAASKINENAKAFTKKRNIDEVNEGDHDTKIGVDAPAKAKKAKVLPKNATKRAAAHPSKEADTLANSAETEEGEAANIKVEAGDYA